MRSPFLVVVLLSTFTAKSSCSTLARVAIQQRKRLDSRTLFQGGWALGLSGSGSSSPSDAPVFCNTTDLHAACCPSGQFCYSTDAEQYCCPSSKPFPTFCFMSSEGFLLLLTCGQSPTAKRQLSTFLSAQTQHGHSTAARAVATTAVSLAK